jgi:hypothetical protein
MFVIPYLIFYDLSSEMGTLFLEIAQECPIKSIHLQTTSFMVFVLACLHGKASIQPENIQITK